MRLVKEGTSSKFYKLIDDQGLLDAVFNLNPAQDVEIFAILDHQGLLLQPLKDWQNDDGYRALHSRTRQMVDAIMLGAGQELSPNELKWAREASAKYLDKLEATDERGNN